MRHTPLPEPTSTTRIVRAVAWIILAVGLLGLIVGIGFAIFSPGIAPFGVEPLLIAVFGGLYLAVGAALLWRLNHTHDEPKAVINTEAPPVQTPAKTSPVVPPLADLLPDKLAALRGDDFTMIEGIGLKVQDVLYQAGITTYAQLAEAEVDTLMELFKGKRRLPVQESTLATWPQQAQYIVDDDLAGLESFQATLPKNRT